MTRSTKLAWLSGSTEKMANSANQPFLLLTMGISVLQAAISLKHSYTKINFGISFIKVFLTIPPVKKFSALMVVINQEESA